MNIRERMMLALGKTPDDKDSIEEMAIKKSHWSWDDDNQPTEKEIDISAREYAKLAILDSLQSTGYWTEKDRHVEKMTSREKGMVNKHIDKFIARIEKMLKPKK